MIKLNLTVITPFGMGLFAITDDAGIVSALIGYESDSASTFLYFLFMKFKIKDN
jgi:hypothetical protein